MLRQQVATASWGVLDHPSDWSVLLFMSQTKPVNERLRHLGGSSKLVLDVLQFDHAYTPAMLSICGCTPPAATTAHVLLVDAIIVS